MNEYIEPYTLLRVSLALFNKPTSELTEHELAKAQRQAKNEFAIESRVLNSPEAAQVNITDDALLSAFAEIENRFSSRSEFEVVLSVNHLSEQSLKLSLFRQCAVNQTLEHVSKRVHSISDVEIGIFYHSHPEKFKSPEQRLARHILISINDDYPENTRDNALARMQALRQTLKRKPHKFSELALQYSECPTAVNGGFLGGVVPGKLYPALECALFSLKENAISEVVETEIGFHLIQCLKITMAYTLSLKNATPKIREYMQARQQTICQKVWLASLPATEKVL